MAKDDIDDDDDYESGLVESIRTATGLEIGCRIHWDTSTPVLELSTVLPPTAIAPMFDGTQWAGTRLWRAAIVAVRYLEQNRDLLLDATGRGNKTILELDVGWGYQE